MYTATVYQPIANHVLAVDMTHGSLTDQHVFKTMFDTIWQNGLYNMFQIIINITRPEIMSAECDNHWLQRNDNLHENFKN